jgi:hypothetical protein
MDHEGLHQPAAGRAMEKPINKELLMRAKAITDSTVIQVSFDRCCVLGERPK